MKSKYQEALRRAEIYIVIGGVVIAFAITVGFTIARMFDESIALPAAGSMSVLLLVILSMFPIALRVIDIDERLTRLVNQQAATVETIVGHEDVFARIKEDLDKAKQSADLTHIRPEGHDSVSVAGSRFDKAKQEWVQRHPEGAYRRVHAATAKTRDAALAEAASLNSTHSNSDQRVLIVDTIAPAINLSIFDRRVVHLVMPNDSMPQTRSIRIESEAVASVIRDYFDLLHSASTRPAPPASIDAPPATTADGSP